MLFFIFPQRCKHQSQCRKLCCVGWDRRSEAGWLSDTSDRSLQAVSRFLQFLSFACRRVCGGSEVECWACAAMCRAQSGVLTSVAFNNTWSVGCQALTSTRTEKKYIYTLICDMPIDVPTRRERRMESFIMGFPCLYVMSHQWPISCWRHTYAPPKRVPEVLGSHHTVTQAQC